jgi:hypothetical protein
MATIGLKVTNAPKSITSDYVEQVSAQISAVGQVEVLSKRAVNIVFEDRNVDARQTNPADKLMEIDAQIVKGEDLLYEGPRDAVKLLRNLDFRLSRLLRESGSNSEVWDRSFRVRMLLSRAYLDSGQREDAEYTLRESIRVFGASRVVSLEAGYHPTLVKAYARSLKSLSGEQNGKLAVDSNPAGAVIVLNGQVSKFTTPHEFTNLYPGAYHVKVSTPEKASLVHYVEIDSKRSTQISIKLDVENHLISEDGIIALRFNRATGVKNQIISTAASLGAWLGVDYVAVLGVVNTSDGEKVRSYLIDVANRQRVSYKSINVPLGQLSMDAVQRTALAMTKPWHTGGGGTSDAMMNNNIIGWGLIGTGTITLGVSIAFALKYSTNESNATNQNWPSKCPALGSGEEKRFGATASTSELKGPPCDLSDPASSPYGQDQRDKAAEAANTATTIGVVTGVLGALMVGGGLWALSSSGIDDSDDTTGTFGIPFPGGARLSPVVGSDSTGVNLGFSF